MRARLRRRFPGPGRGETLVELLVATFLIGSAGLVLVGALAAATLQADRTNDQAVARDLVASVAALAGSDSPRFTPCAAPTDYQPAVSAMERNGYHLTVVEVANWTGGSFAPAGPAAPCDPANQHLQRITVRADGPNGTVQQVVVAKSSTRLDGSTALTEPQTAAGSGVGQFNLSVSSYYDAAHAPGGPVRFAVFGPTDVTCTHPLWQTVANPGDPRYNPAAGAGVAPTVALPSVGDAVFNRGQASVTVPVFTVADAYGDQPGDYRWRATYLGDARSGPSASSCGGPGREISLDQTAISLPDVTIAPGGAAVYQPVLEHVQSVPGALTFTVHGVGAGPSGQPCTTGAALRLPPQQPGTDGTVNQVIDPGIYGGFGDYRITLDYPGDTTHLPLHETCAQGHPLRVLAGAALGVTAPRTPAGPMLVASMGQGWLTPPGQDAGMVTFTTYNTADCAIPLPGVTATVAMANGQASASFAGLAPANYWARAAWTGDTRNAAATSGCVPFPVLASTLPGPGPLMPPGPMSAPVALTLPGSVPPLSVGGGRERS
jgi:hypothetical protein